MITAFGSEEVYREALGRGATAYLEKSIHLSKLRTLMDRVVSSKGKMMRR
jgi:DNA-binding NtrC family response regulator